jgi:hypothetical protein
MTEWQPIETIDPDLKGSVIVYVPTETNRKVFEAIASPGGGYCDPVYDEWDGKGATHWMPLPEPPK